MEKKAYHHNNLRNDLIQAGIKIIYEEGFDNLSLRKAAVMCGVSHAAPKNHFKDKEEFTEEIKKYVGNEFSAYLQNAVEQSEDDESRVRDMGRAYIQFFMDNPKYFRLILEQKDISIHISETHIEDSDYMPFQIFQKNASTFLRSKGMPDELIPKKIIELWALVTGLVSLQLVQGFHYDGDWMEMVNKIVGCGY